MAKKITDSSIKKTEPEKSDVYPWLRLLELEVKPSPRPKPRLGRGRPPNPFPRHPIHVTLTDDELASLDALVESLSERFGARLHRGHLIAFLVFYLQSRLQVDGEIVIPDDITSLKDLAEHLNEAKYAL